MLKPRLPRILLVDDEQGVRDAIVLTLFYLGFDVREAADGRDAIDLLASGTRIDLVLSDLLLPEVDGWTLFLHVKKHYPRVPFVFATAVHDDTIMQKALDAGVDGYLFEPFERADLWNTLRSALKC